MKKLYAFYKDYIIRQYGYGRIHINKIVNNSEVILEEICWRHAIKYPNGIVRDVLLGEVIVQELGNGNEAEVDNYYIFSNEDIERIGKFMRIAGTDDFIGGHTIYHPKRPCYGKHFTASIEIAKTEVYNLLRSIAKSLGMSIHENWDEYTLGINLIESINSDSLSDSNNQQYEQHLLNCHNKFNKFRFNSVSSCPELLTRCTDEYTIQVSQVRLK